MTNTAAPDTTAPETTAPAQDDQSLLLLAGITPGDQPNVPEQTQTATTPKTLDEQEAEAKGNAAPTSATATAPVDTAPAAETKEEPETAAPQEQFSSSFISAHAHLLNDLWGVGTVDVLADQAIRSAKKSSTGIVFDLLNGHQVQWFQSQAGEFIGGTKKEIFDADDAAAIISLSKTKGWDSVNVHGSVEQRELLWLEAMRQDVKVGNFMPKPDSDVAKKWAEEVALRKELANENETPGVTQSDADAPDTAPEAKAPDTAEEPEAETEAAAPAAPVAAAAEVEAPVAEAETAEAAAPATFDTTVTTTPQSKFTTVTTTATAAPPPVAAAEALPTNATAASEAEADKPGTSPAATQSVFLKQEAPKAEEKKAAEQKEQKNRLPRKEKKAQIKQGKFVQQEGNAKDNRKNLSVQKKPKSDIGQIIAKAKQQQKQNKGPG